MKVSGFTLIRNGISFDYPWKESILSLLLLVDELVVNVGVGTDETLTEIKKFAKELGQGKIKIFENDWQLDRPEKKRGGLILSEQTNLALDRCQNDWCVYLQADEILHEDDISILRRNLLKYQNHPEVEGLLFDYVHFYGSYDVIQVSRSAYRREVRAVKKSSGAKSVGDAQSFRKKDGTKLSVVRSEARVFHYGWVRTPEAMREKTFFMDQLYHGEPILSLESKRTPHTGDNYKYKKFWGLRTFLGTHPNVMKDRIDKKGWHWNLSESPWVFSLKDLKKIPLDLIEAVTGHRLFEYCCYKLKRER
ncbi:MAG: glycosyltransferase family 2 protein [Bdellovibrionota bacterium]